MSTNIKLKRSSVSGNIPTTAQLESGEIAINTADGKLFFKKGSSDVIEIRNTDTETLKQIGWEAGYGHTTLGSYASYNTEYDALQFDHPSTNAPNMTVLFRAFEAQAGERILVTVPFKLDTINASMMNIFLLQCDEGTFNGGATHLSDHGIEGSSTTNSALDATGVSKISLATNTGATSTVWQTYQTDVIVGVAGYYSLGIQVKSTYGTNTVHFRKPEVKSVGTNLASVIALNYVLG
jgi:hypothetical protein